MNVGDQVAPKRLGKQLRQLFVGDAEILRHSNLLLDGTWVVAAGLPSADGRLGGLANGRSIISGVTEF